MPRRRRSHLRPAAVVATMTVVTGLLGACGGGSGDDDQQPDEFTFCRLALVNQPVAEADAPVWRRLDELAPDEIDDAVVVLRDAAEELEELDPGSPELLAAEFEVRFREEYLTARTEVEAFLADECAEYIPTTTTTTASRPGVTDSSETETPGTTESPVPDDNSRTTTTAEEGDDE